MSLLDYIKERIFKKQYTCKYCGYINGLPMVYCHRCHSELGHTLSQGEIFNIVLNIGDLSRTFSKDVNSLVREFSASTRNGKVISPFLIEKAPSVLVAPVSIIRDVYGIRYSSSSLFQRFMDSLEHSKGSKFIEEVGIHPLDFMFSVLFYLDSRYTKAARPTEYFNILLEFVDAPIERLDFSPTCSYFTKLTDD